MDYASPCDDWSQYQHEVLAKLEAQDHRDTMLVHKLLKLQPRDMYAVVDFIRAVVANEEFEGDYADEVQKCIKTLNKMFKGELNDYDYKV